MPGWSSIFLPLHDQTELTTVPVMTRLLLLTIPVHDSQYVADYKKKKRTKKKAKDSHLQTRKVRNLDITLHQPRQRCIKDHKRLNQETDKSL